MAAKMSRYLTHIRKLQDPQEPIERFFSRARALGDKLGPVLLQLPATLKADPVVLDETLSLKTLAEWVARLQDQWGPGDDVYVFFNNDPRACALRDAIWFAGLMQEAGWDTTRVPKRSDVTVGDIDSAAWALDSPLGAKVRTG